MVFPSRDSTDKRNSKGNWNFEKLTVIHIVIFWSIILIVNFKALLIMGISKEELFRNLFKTAMHCFALGIMMLSVFSLISDQDLNSYHYKIWNFMVGYNLFAINIMFFV